mmetsp:Transcript_18604/g.31767  ORF Transcript_18604/g.31767 Transcript_18604/m.31767 type:complete len:119 (-) Transcript_18604:115-471(-)
MPPSYTVKKPSCKLFWFPPAHLPLILTTTTEAEEAEAEAEEQKAGEEEEKSGEGEEQEEFVRQPSSNDQEEAKPPAANGEKAMAKEEMKIMETVVIPDLPKQDEEEGHHHKDPTEPGS